MSSNQSYDDTAATTHPARDIALRPALEAAMSNPSSPTELADKQAIYEVVLRYCRGVDRRDFDLIRSAYHPDALDHHTGFDGTIDEYIAWLGGKLARFDGTMHFIGNHYVELVGGDRAISETYSTATHWGKSAGDGGLVGFTSGARFVDLMERRDGIWAIAERWAVREWTRPEAGGFTRPEGPGPRGTHDDTDPLYRLRARLVVPPGSTTP